MGLTVGLGVGLGFCAKAGKGDNPIAAVAADLRKPRRVVLVNDQLPSPIDAEAAFPGASLSDAFRKSSSKRIVDRRAD